MVATVTGGCSGSTTYPPVTSVVDTARADQLAFASTYQRKGIAFRGTVQKKGVKAATAVGFDFTGSGLGNGPVTGGSARRINVNYGYVFLGDGSAEAKRALCLFEPDNLKEAAGLPAQARAGGVGLDAGLLIIQRTPQLSARLCELRNVRAVTTRAGAWPRGCRSESAAGIQARDRRPGRARGWCKTFVRRCRHRAL